MPKRISKRSIDSLEAGATIWDGEMPGFGCRKTAKGVASYVLKYRYNGRQRWLTIGRHGAPWTPDSARKEALRALSRLSEGLDPATEKANKLQGETVLEFSERYKTEYSAHHKKPSSRDADGYHLKNHIIPHLGSKRLDAVTRQDVAKLHHSLSNRPYTANRVLALLSHMYSTAERWGALPDGSNPCRHITRYKEKGRERFLSPKEIKRLGSALTEAEKTGESIYVTNAIRLLIFTGARLGEILTMQWKDVDTKSNLIRLVDSKTGAKTIALPAPAVDILGKLPRMRGNSFVICGRKPAQHLVNLQKPWRRIRKVAELEDVRIHDLRHSFASVAVSGGMSLPLIGSLLGHTQPQTTQRYAHLADDPRLAAAESIASTIAANLDGHSGEVIPLKKGRC